MKSFKMPMSGMSVRRWRLICLVLTSLGFLASGYLLSRTFVLLENDSSEGADLCLAVFSASCDKTLLSDNAWHLGIPLAGWGIVYYATLAAVLTLGWFLGDAFHFEAALGAVLIAIAGACVSLLLLCHVAIGSSPFCPVCLVIQLVNLALVPALLGFSQRSMRQFLDGLRAVREYLLGRPTGIPPETAWKVVGFVTVALVAVVAYQWVFVQSALRIAAASKLASPLEIIKSYESARLQHIPTAPDDPRMGPVQAPVQVVVFTDFQCPACRRLAEAFQYLTEHFDGKVAIYLKHFPLSDTCNSYAESNKHPDSCAAAFASEAARQQGKFWQFHDVLLNADLTVGDQVLRRIAIEIGLEVDWFETSFRSQTTFNKIQSDCELGNRLGVHATPTVFLNRRKLRRPTPDSIDILIHHLLEKPAE